MKPLRIVSAEPLYACLESWRRDGKFAAIDDDPLYGAFGRAYYPAVFEERRRDVSFAVTDGERPLLVLPCTRGMEDLDYYGFAICVYRPTDVAESEAQRAIATAFTHLDRLASEDGARRVIIRDDGSIGNLSLIGKQCLNRGAAANVRLTAICALDDGESGMRRGLRKSFQSLINWGKRNLKLASVDAVNPDRALFESYRTFHATVAGRVTRSEPSWRAMFDWIAGGHGELVLGYLSSGELVTGTMVVDGGSKSAYASGVYDRNRFDQPLGHWPLWVAMLSSAKRGMRVFELGDIPLAGAANDKEIAIGYFKRGFATDIATWINWRIDAKDSKGK